MAQKKLKLGKSTDFKEPETFEEWVKIHGEPEYLFESKSRKRQLNIEVIERDIDETPVDTSGIIIMSGKNGDKKEINYGEFVDVFAELNKIVYCNGIFYSPDGVVTNQAVRNDIANTLKDMGWTARLDVPTNSIFTSLKDMHSVDRLSVDEHIIPLANGDLSLKKGKWKFYLNEKTQTPYRLSVSYNPVEKPMPLFNKWLEDVFMPEDIPVVQEIMGYCLVPTTAAQEAFFLVGDAGVGKSGLGTILEGLLGNAFEVTETQQLVTERFQLAKVENKLVIYDDDLGSAALTETGTLKKLITADQNIPAERKYGDPYSFKSYCKVVASANFMLSSLYDDSDGFYRRLHPILVKPKDPERKTIRDFYKLILENEKEQILRWALVGLRRVIDNGFKISWSDRSREYLGTVKSSVVHFNEFFEDVCEPSDSGDISSAELIKAYKKWCKENGIKESSERRMTKWFADNHEKLCLIQSANLTRQNRRVRGYKGAKIKDEWRSLF